MTTLREGLPPLPPKMAHLPIDHRGYPVPFFVDYVNGEPDHRIADPRKLVRCVRERLCWLCGRPFGRRDLFSFVVGPMCTISLVSSEAAAHEECSIYALQACPFLTRPKAQRRDIGIEDKQVAGIMSERNPGVSCMWVTKSAQLFNPGVGGKGWLFQLGPPVRTPWFREGRPATRDEVEEAVATGLPTLQALCENQSDVTDLTRLSMLAKLQRDAWFAHLEQPVTREPDRA